MWAHLKKTSLINQRGQTILELATFGSVLLFCLALLIHFGLQMNYQQNVQMQAFRKALKLAYYKQGPNSQASLTMIKDKPAVDPRDRWGFADRVSIGGSAAVTWSNTLNGVYVNDISETPDDRDMPRTFIEVNKKTDADNAQIKDGMGLADAEINDNLDKNRVATKAKGAFVTGAWNRIDVIDLIYVGIYLENSDHKYGPKDYDPLVVDPANIKVFEDPQDPQQKSAVYQYDGLKRTLSSGVLILDEWELLKFYSGKSIPVNIIAVRGAYGNDCDDDSHYCGTLQQMLYIDSTIGAINTYYVDVKPWDQDKTLQNKQGLLMDSDKEMNYGNGANLTVAQTGGTISTRTESSATQTITHKIRLNNNSIQDVSVIFKPNQTYKYEVKQ